SAVLSARAPHLYWCFYFKNRIKIRYAVEAQREIKQSMLYSDSDGTHQSFNALSDVGSSSFSHKVGASRGPLPARSEPVLGPITTPLEKDIMLCSKFT
ncbi:MAG: hypothetical protein LUP95_05310, partial [Euryarchaeota archaeon]|nr:hypothetical protein [Euryarchaeota archaeon]